MRGELRAIRLPRKLSRVCLFLETKSQSWPISIHAGLDLFLFGGRLM